jgi:hypothetical protein
MPLKPGPLQFGQSSQNAVAEITQASIAATLRAGLDVVLSRIVIQTLLVQNFRITRSIVAIGRRVVVTIVVGEVRIVYRS